jgi:hypothetical protein
MGSSMNYSPSSKVVVPCKDDIAISNTIRRILLRHNLTLTSYSSAGVGFYKKTVSGQSVPVFNRYHLPRHEFHLLLDKLKEIDELGNKVGEIRGKFDTFARYVANNK